MRASTFNPNAHNNYQPNPVQMEFIRLAAEKYWYLAFGDMSHEHPSISAFALNRATVDTLAQAGKENYFLEEPLSAQKYFNAVSRDPESGGHDSNLFNSAWLDPLDKRELARLLSDSVQAVRSIKFICADTRSGKIASLKAALLGDMAQSFGDPESLTSPWLKKLADNALGAKNKNLSDDRKTVSLIKSFKGPSAILFGAGHFAGEFETAEARTSMRSLLPENGKSLCVFNIMTNHTQACGLVGAKPDAELYVVEPYGNADIPPYGIRLINPDLEPLLSQALKNTGKNADIAAPACSHPG